MNDFAFPDIINFQLAAWQLLGPTMISKETTEKIIVRPRFNRGGKMEIPCNERKSKVGLSVALLPWLQIAL